MDHIAKKFGIDSLNFRRINLIKQGDKTSTGGTFRDRVMLPEIIDKVTEMSSYKEKKEKFQDERDKGKLKGIGLSVFFHCGGFTGSGERDIIKARVKLQKYSDDSVEVLIANVDMGQGAQTSLRKIAARALDIPLERIIFKNPDTDRVPDSGPTVASRTTVIVGRLIKDAAEELKLKWKEGKAQEAEVDYKHPEGFPWDGDKLMGDAYTSYSWGANVVEVEVDPVTYETSIGGAWAVYDVGKAIDDRIIKGQIDGGVLQGLGFASIEVVENKGGRFVQRTSTDCIVPTSKDAPLIESALICEPYEGGPYGAKGMGELTLVGAPAAYALAVENALGIDINSIPVRPEYLMEVAKHEK
jgi:CO/xanthine dehydrogenase Mo-binding subunit